MELNSNNYTKFIIIGEMRTGTTYVQSLLSSHPQVKSYSEVFHLLSLHFNNKDLLHKIIESPTDYARQEIYRSYPDHIKAVGFKAVYGQLGSDNVFLRKMDTEDVDARTKERRELFFQFIQTNIDVISARQQFDNLLNFLRNDLSIKVIHTKRWNKLDTLLSVKFASLSGAWNSVIGSYIPGPISLDFKECVEFFAKLDAQEEKHDALFQAHALIEVIYEDLIIDTRGWKIRIQDFLGVEYQSLSSPLDKQNKLPASRAVSNFPELREKFENTEWIKYFES